VLGHPLVERVLIPGTGPHQAPSRSFERHTWPGSEFSKGLANIIGPTTFDIDASEEIWSFFERFRLPR